VKKIQFQLIFVIPKSRDWDAANPEIRIGKNGRDPGIAITSREPQCGPADHSGGAVNGVMSGRGLSPENFCRYPHSVTSRKCCAVSDSV